MNKLVNGQLVELTSDEDDDELCDFKEDWRCN